MKESRDLDSIPSSTNWLLCLGARSLGIGFLIYEVEDYLVTF